MREGGLHVIADVNRKYFSNYLSECASETLKRGPRYGELFFSWMNVATPVTSPKKSMDVLDFVKNLGTLKTNCQTDLCSIHPHWSNKAHLYSHQTKTMTCLLRWAGKKDWMLRSPPPKSFLYLTKKVVFYCF